MKFLATVFVLSAIYIGILFFVRVPRGCEKYEPTVECHDSIYRIYLYEKPWFRYPSAIVDAHCVYTKPGRVVAQTVRFTAYFEYPEHDSVSDVWWAEEQEFPSVRQDGCLPCPLRTRDLLDKVVASWKMVMDTVQMVKENQMKNKQQKLIELLSKENDLLHEIVDIAIDYEDSRMLPLLEQVLELAEQREQLLNKGGN